jgi:hypothetical protein
MVWTKCIALFGLQTAKIVVPDKDAQVRVCVCVLYVCLPVMEL